MHMNDDDQLEAAEDEAVEAADGDEGEAPSREDEARKQGWVPRSEFRGDPEDWTPADEYLRMGDPKYLRKLARDQKRELRKLAQAREQDAQAFAARLDRFEAMSKAQRAKLYGDIETARRQAVEAGDTAEYDRLNKVEADLYEQEQATGKTTAKKDTAKADEPHPDVEAWVQDNPWFTRDKVLNRAAQGIHEQILDDEPGLTIAENLAKTKRELMKRFPEKFGRSAPAKSNGHSAVEGGQRVAAAAKGKGFTDIPAEERRIIERHIEEGLYKDKAEAAKAYWS
jgi:hypothetical protein